MYQSNQKRLFELLEKQERSNDVVPDAEESRTFWDSIWNVHVTNRSREDKETVKENAKLESSRDGWTVWLLA